LYFFHNANYAGSSVFWLVQSLELVCCLRFSFESFFSFLALVAFVNYFVIIFFFTGFRMWLGVGWFDFFKKKSSNTNPQFIFNIFINSWKFISWFWHLINSNEFLSKKLERFDYRLLLTVCWVLNSQFCWVWIISLGVFFLLG